MALCSYAYVVLTDIEEASAEPALEVRVVGEQFTWTFFYENPDGGGEDVASPQLYVPQGQQVHFTVQTKDVLHDFWVPAFRMKIDAVRGIGTEIRVTPTKLGDYPVVCAELCGLGHAAMRQTAHVVAPDEFESWLQERAQQAAGGGEQEEGGGAAGGEEGAARRTARPSSRPRAAAAATRWPTPARPAAPGPTSTRASPTRTRRSSRRASWTRPRRSRRASRTGSCRRATARR